MENFINLDINPFLINSHASRQLLFRSRLPQRHRACSRVTLNLLPSLAFTSLHLAAPLYGGRKVIQGQVLSNSEQK